MYCLKQTQKLPLTIKECWDFFSSPANLKIITPKHLGFEMTHGLENERMYPGQIIAYTIRPVWNIPIEWVTEITQAEEPYYFIDEQRFGPYKFWHHEHRFKEIATGVEMTDTVYYKMPFGPIGKALHILKVKKDLDKIFAYRNEQLKKMFDS